MNKKTYDVEKKRRFQSSMYVDNKLHDESRKCEMVRYLNIQFSLIIEKQNSYIDVLKSAKLLLTELYSQWRPSTYHFHKNRHTMVNK